MKTKVTKRGQVSVPSAVRRQLHIGPNVTLEWIVEGATARVIPVPADPVKAFRGSGHGYRVNRIFWQIGFPNKSPGRAFSSRQLDRGNRDRSRRNFGAQRSRIRSFERDSAGNPKIVTLPSPPIPHQNRRHPSNGEKQRWSFEMETVPQQFALIVLNQGQENVLKDIVDEMPRWIEMMEIRVVLILWSTGELLRSSLVSRHRQPRGESWKARASEPRMRSGPGPLE